ncbi:MULTISPECIES: arginyltransferase [Methylomonas]|uniref:arginyltransferase n=1 Tax=Methylomonas TaxID=416 RepID=UPI001232AC9F|nr:arginyltransferase [Methylomonas rhizoryzae]
MNSALPLWLTSESACGYFDDRLSQSIVVHPRFAMNSQLYEQLLAKGFRRSGEQVYRPHCSGCNACVPTRIPVAAFKPSRPQKRCQKRNLGTEVVIKTPEFTERHFELYRLYLARRHDGGLRPEITREDYLHFLTSSWCNTWFVEFLIDGKLAAVAVVDAFANALSAVYTFFDPQFDAYSPGVYAVLWQIEEAKRRNLDFLYLGFWIADCRKMRYKNQYQPLQGLIGDSWQPVQPHQPTHED